MMASPNLVCGNCGTQLSEGDAYCSKCGVKVERATRRCEVCGHVNAHAEQNCESCGARLPAFIGAVARTVAPKASSTPVRQTGGSKPRKKGRKAVSSFRAWERWQFLAAGMIVLVVAFFVYTQLKSNEPPGAPAGPDPLSAVPPVSPQEIERLQKVVDANPADALSTLRLANLLHDNGSRDPQSIVRAVEMYKRYLAMNPDNPDARVDLGVCYFELGRKDSSRSQEYFTSAIKEMETAFAAHPTHQTAAFNLGIVNLHAGNMEAASKWFVKAVEIDSSSTLGARAKQLLEQHSFQALSQ